MRLASFQLDGRPAYGLVAGGDSLHPAPEAFRARFPDLAAVLAAGATTELSAAARREPARSLATVRFLPVIPAPRKIICVGINYLAHMREMGREQPAWPTLFTRFPDSLVGHGETLLRPRESARYDYEGELALVIGRPARRVAAADALAHVAGYTCLLDGSVRDWQNHTTQFIPGKNFPATGSCGPWLVTADELTDPSRLYIETRINGEVLQSAPTADLCFDVPSIIEYISAFTPLVPGDVLATGTPSGVGFARQPPRWLVPGDVVEVTLSGVGGPGIGTLRNVVADDAG
jgi:2-keto-4-pentenoate hydratase/2-oxohepta-3-ene-1,7-dioic acid hydratase in catechol pathway